MAADEGTAAEQEPPRARLAMDGGAQTVRLPAGWELPGTEARLRRVGESVVLEPISTPAAEHTFVGPGVPPDYWEWLEGARARGEFDHDDVERFDIQFRDVDDVP